MTQAISLICTKSVQNASCLCEFLSECLDSGKQDNRPTLLFKILAPPTKFYWFFNKIFIILSLLIYHCLLMSNLSTPKLIKPLGSSTVTSISMLSYSSNSSHFVLLFSFPIFSYYSSVWNPPPKKNLPLILKFSKKLNTALKTCSHK